MPKSKGRRKKTKVKSTRSKARTNVREVFTKDGIELSREGKNIFFKNNRSPEEQQAYLESTKENRPKHLQEIESQISEIILVFEQFDNIKILGGLAYLQFASQSNQQDNIHPELALEYGLSFSSAIEGNPTVAPSGKLVLELKDRLESIRHSYIVYLTTEHATGKYSALEGSLRYRTILESLCIRGIAYTQHIHLIYNELFLAHDGILERAFGFKSQDILETIIQLEDSFCCRLRMPNGLPHPTSFNRLRRWEAEKGMAIIVGLGPNLMKEFAKDNPDMVIENDAVITYGFSNIQTYPELFRIKPRTPLQAKVIKAISQRFGDNSKFLNPEYKGLPTNESKAFLKPVIQVDDEYYHFAFNLPTRNLFELTEALIKESDSKYYKNNYLGNKYSNSRDNFLEKKSAELFQQLLPHSTCYRNLKYEAEKEYHDGILVPTELDLLVTTNLANYLVEMKAGGLSAPSKRGALLSLQGQLKGTIGYGAFQNHRALKYIQENEHPCFYEKNGTSVPIDKKKKTFRVTITLDNLAGFLASMYDLKELNIIASNVGFCWNCSIFDLVVFSEILESETDFVEYLEKRIPLYARPELNFDDEIQLLGHFLENNLDLDENLIKELSGFTLNNFSEAIDNYFENNGPKPKRKRM